MKKNAFFLFLISAIILSQSCKKSSSTTDDTTTTPIFQAYIGGMVWAPDTTSTIVTYDAVAKTKVLKVMGVKAQKQIEITFNDPNPTDNNGLTLGTYNVDALGNTAFNYSTQKKDGKGNYVFVSQGTVPAGYGTLKITAVDTVNKTITGSYTFISSKYNYDENGKLISVDVANITAGTITNMPYTYKTSATQTE